MAFKFFTAKRFGKKARCGRHARYVRCGWGAEGRRSAYESRARAGAWAANAGWQPGSLTPPHSQPTAYCASVQS